MPGRLTRGFEKERANQKRLAEASVKRARVLMKGRQSEDIPLWGGQNIDRRLADRYVPRRSSMQELGG